MTKTIDLVYFNAGGGHRAAALALQEAIHEQGRPWNVRLVHLMEVLDPQSRFKKITGFAPEDIYNLRLKRGWTLGLAQELKLLQRMIRLGHATLLRSLQQHWLRTEPDLVVSLVPNFNRALCESLASTLPGVPFVTVMTDLADHPPNFWIEPGQQQHLVCGTPWALSQARAAGCPPQRLWLTSGMVLRPSFYRQGEIDRDAGLRALGLNPALPTGVVMFGGHGSLQMLSIAKALADRQLILMCGHNQALADKLRELPGSAAQAPNGSPADTPAATAAHAVLGFTNEVSRHLRLGDYLIGKPGPGSLSEAVQLGLPVITFENAWTLPQERYNAQWVREQGIGLVLQNLRSVLPAVAEMVAGLPAFQARVRAIHNRAVFEVPDILADLLAASAMPPANATQQPNFPGLGIAA